MFEHLAPGQQIGGRYRLERELGSDARCSVWRATDQRLERQVALRIYDPTMDNGVLQRQAGLAASLTHPRVVRLFDTGFDAGHFFVVTELLPASLAWAGLPLDVDEATSLGVGVAEALVYSHDRGVAHGNLHAGNVLLSEQGVKVADFALNGPSLDGSVPDTRMDVRDLGRLMHLVLTGQEAPTEGPVTDVPGPRALSKLTSDLMSGVYPTAAVALRDLRELRPEPGQEKRRRPIVVVSMVLLALVLATLGAVGATRLGERTDSTPEAPAPPVITGDAHAFETLSDYDPLGDQREGRATVPRIADGDVQTFWSAERYSGGADFSGLKEGVGVILNLGSAKPVGRAQVVLVTPGCSYELRHADRREARPDRWNTVATARAAPRTNVLEFPATRGQWWLLWVTELVQGVPGAGGAWSCGVSEVGLYPP